MCFWDANAVKGSAESKVCLGIKKQINTFVPSWVGHSSHFWKSGDARVSSATAACSPQCRPNTRGRGPPRRAAGHTRTSHWLIITARGAAAEAVHQTHVFFFFVRRGRLLPHVVAGVGHAFLRRRPRNQIENVRCTVMRVDATDKRMWLRTNCHSPISSFQWT